MPTTRLLTPSLISNLFTGHLFAHTFISKSPHTQFQHAKLKFESYLRSKADSITHTIVRPTAFFKSVSGQLEIVQQGACVRRSPDVSI